MCHLADLRINRLFGIIRVCGKSHPETGRVFSPAIVRVVVGPFYSPGFRSKKGREMFEGTKARLSAKYVEPVTRSVTAALWMAGVALILAALAFIRSL